MFGGLVKQEHPTLIPLQCLGIFSVAFLFFSVVVPGVWYDGGFPAFLEAVKVNNVRFDTFETIIARDGNLTLFATKASLLILAVALTSVTLSLAIRARLDSTMSKLRRVALHLIMVSALAVSVFTGFWLFFVQSFQGNWSGGFEYAKDFFTAEGAKDFAWCAAVVQTIAFVICASAAVFDDEFSGIFPATANKIIPRVLWTFSLSWVLFRWVANPAVIRAIAVKVGFRSVAPVAGANDTALEELSQLDQFATIASASHVLAFLAGTVCCYITRQLLEAAAARSLRATKSAISALTAVTTWAVVALATMVVFWSVSLWLQFASSNGIEFVSRYQSVAFDEPASREASAIAACSFTLWFLLGALVNEVQSVPTSCARAGDALGIRRVQKLGRASQRVVDSQTHAERRALERKLAAPLLLGMVAVLLMLAVAEPRFLGSWIARVQRTASWTYNLVPTGWTYLHDNYSKDQLFWMTLPVLFITEIPLYFFTVLDILKLKSLDKYRIHYTKIDHKRPRRYPSNEELWKCWKVHCVNFFGGYCGTFVVGVGAAIQLGIYPYTFTRKLPDHWLLEFFVLSFFSDCLFYWIHRVAHHPKLYARLHKMHHEWVYTISLAHHYMELSEALLFMIPPVLPAMLFRSHIAIVWMYMFWAQLNGILGHSAFMLPVLSKFLKYLPALRPDYHDLHHLRFNVNYGATYTFTDKIFGTYRYEPIIYIDGVDPMLVQDGLTESDPFAHNNIKEGGYAIVGGDDDTSIKNKKDQ